MIDRLIKISSLSGALLIFCGILKLIFFYSAFSIDIVDYLSFSEIITSFLDDINILLILFIVMIIQSLPVLNFMHKKSKMSVEDFYNELLKIIYPYRYRYVMGFTIAFVAIITLMIFNVFHVNYLLIYCLIFCLIQIMTFVSMYKEDSGNIEISNSSIGISVLISIIIAIFLLAKHDIQSVYAQRDSIEIKTKDTIIDCNIKTNIIYLGKTDSYVFLRDLKKQTSLIIPVNEIKEFSFRKTQ